MIHRQKNIYIYKYLFWAKYPPFYAPDQEKKNLKFFYAPYGLKEYRCKVSTIYLYYYKSYYKLQETSEVLWQKLLFFYCIGTWPLETLITNMCGRQLSFSEWKTLDNFTIAHYLLEMHKSTLQRNHKLK